MRRFFFFLSDSVCDLHYEVLPESETSFSVTFQPPGADSLAVCKHLPQIITKIKVSLIRQSPSASTCASFLIQQQWPIFIYFDLDFFRPYDVLFEDNGIETCMICGVFLPQCW